MLILESHIDVPTKNGGEMRTLPPEAPVVYKS